MAQLPITFISYEQLLQNSIRSYQSRLGLNDLNVNAVILSLLETTCQNDFQILSQQIAVLDAQNIDRAAGNQLDLIGTQEGCFRLQANYASGPVDIVDSSFIKISTRIYSGLPSPIQGTTTLYVDDASSFPATGSVIIGRGTPSIETIPYSSVSNQGTYWQINLSSAMNNTHAQGDSVIVSQGGTRQVSAGTNISTPLSAGITQVTFSINQQIVLPDGENEVDGIPVISTQTGTIGNIETNTLTSFGTPPFAGATVTNPISYTNGRDVESDFNYRERIKETRAARSLGIDQSIVNNVIGLTSPDELKQILSAKITDGTQTQPAVLTIDDGTGYEATFQDIGLENVLNSAEGGEPFLQTQFFPIAKARLVSFATEPFNLSGGEILAIYVGETLSEHVFQPTDFQFPGSATAYEVIASINADASLLYSARTINNASQVLIFGVSDTNESLLIATPSVGTNANDALVFPSSEQNTLYLYKNNFLLNKDGTIAQLTSNPFPWNLPGTSYGLTLSIDGTSNVTFTFNSTNLTPYVPSNAPLNTWVTAFNNTIPGITAINQNNLLVISSNKGANDQASINLSLSQSSLLSNNQVFSNYSSTGTSSDYSVRRGNGQIELAVPAAVDDQYTLGTPDFKAQIVSTPFTTGAVSITYSGTPTSGRLWTILDNQVSNIPLSLTTNISISVSNTSFSTVWRYTDLSGVGIFANVRQGDDFITYDPAFNYSTTQNNQGGFKVSNASTTWIEVEKLTGLNQTVTLSNILANSVYRSDGRLEEIDIASAVYSLQGLVTTLTPEILGGTFDVYKSNDIRLRTNTPDSTGVLSLLAIDNAAQNTNLALTINQNNLPMHSASIVAGNTDLGTPLFVDYYKNISNTSSLILNLNSSITIFPDEMAVFLRQASVTRYGQNLGNWAGVKHWVKANSTVTLVNKLQINPFFFNDRLYKSRGYDFTGNDELFVILDNNPDAERFSLDCFRDISVTSSPAPTVSSFSANDADAQNLSLTVGFGSAFDFSNYRLYGAARGLVVPDSTDSAFIVRSVPFGKAGEFYRFGLQYPTSGNQATTFSVNTSSTIGTIDLNVYLPSSAALTPNYDGTTTFNVNSSGLFSYNSGTTPNFTNMGVSVGYIVDINGSTSFTSSNQGAFRITNISATTFTINNATVTQSAVSINATGNLSFYSIHPTNSTATNIVSFININMTNYITAALGVGVNGSGTINKVFSDFSTGFTQPTSVTNLVQLTDGENWVSSCSLTSSPQFTTERNFSITSAFYNLSGETLKLIPYTTQQLMTLWDAPAFGGISNFGIINTGNQGDALSISSLEFGSASAVQIEGGTGNAVFGSVYNNNTYLGSTFEKIIVPAGVIEGTQSKSWIKLSSSKGLKKNLGTNASTVFYTQLPSTLGVSITGTFQVQRSSSISANTNFIVEKEQNFVAFAYTGFGNPPNLTCTQGDYAVIDGNFSLPNRGTYRVVNSTATTFWIANTSFTPEIVFCAGATDIKFYSAGSFMPGDSLVISGGILNSLNDGTYTVLSSTTNSLQIQSTFQVSTTASASSQFDNVQGFDADLIDIYREVQTTVLSEPGAPSGYGSLILSKSISQLSGLISQQNGFTLQTLNKLNFSTDPIFGINGYSVYTGLIKSASQEVFGDPTNPTVYPGLISPGSYLEVAAPIIKRVLLSIGVRLSTGVSLDAVESNIQNNIIGVINAAGIGQNVPFSNIISVVNTIAGVVASTLLSPTWTANNDSLVVTSKEKLLVINAEDISVSILQ